MECKVPISKILRDMAIPFKCGHFLLHKFGNLLFWHIVCSVREQFIVQFEFSSSGNVPEMA